MILLDDNFSSIVTAVEEGRRIFDNMKKTIAYILAGSVTTLYPFIVYVIFGFPIAIGAITILLIALGTDMMPAISLAYEKAESDIMKQAPRNPKTDNLVTSNLLYRSYAQIGVIMSSAGYLGYFVAFLHYGWKPQDLWQLRVQWDDPDLTLSDSFGGQWVCLISGKYSGTYILFDRITRTDRTCRRSLRARTSYALSFASGWM